MYKLTMLFFFLTAYSSQSLMNNYKIVFENEDATYTLKIDNGSLAFENDQPGVTVTADGVNSVDTNKAPFGSAQEPPSTSRKTYKITKGATFEEGLKIGGNDEVAIDKIGAEDGVATDREMNPLLFGVKDHQAYEIILSYELVTVVEKSSKTKTVFPIEDGVYLRISGDKFGLFK